MYGIRFELTTVAPAGLFRRSAGSRQHSPAMGYQNSVFGPAAYWRYDYRVTLDSLSRSTQNRVPCVYRFVVSVLHRSFRGCRGVYRCRWRVPCRCTDTGARQEVKELHLGREEGNDTTKRYSESCVEGKVCGTCRNRLDESSHTCRSSSHSVKRTSWQFLVCSIMNRC